MVGALADWFAVTALFRSPFGLPIPHTGIIPRNKDRIGGSVADFLENNFLTTEVITAELRSINFAAIAGKWLDSEKNRQSVSEQILHLSPAVLHAIDAKSVISFLQQRAASMLSTSQLGPLAADLIQTIVAQNKHHYLFDLMLSLGIETLAHNRPLIRQKIHERSPRWIPQSVDERFFIGLLEELDAFLEKMRAPDSEWRKRFDALIDELLHKLRSSPVWEANIAAMVHQAINHPHFTEYSLDLWRDTTARLVEDMQLESSNCGRQLDRGLQAVAQLLGGPDETSQKLNGWLLNSATAFIVARRQLIASLVRRVIQTWDGETVSRKFELYIGRDLQYIRINGTIVGGFAGLALHLVSLAL